jgi:hypothetical protein
MYKFGHEGEYERDTSTEKYSLVISFRERQLDERLYALYFWRTGKYYSFPKAKVFESLKMLKCT